MTSLVSEHGRKAPLFSMALQTEILSILTSDFLKQMIILKSFNSVLKMFEKPKVAWHAILW